MPKNNFRFAELFAGIGLMRLGLEKSGWTCEFANDIDPAKASMYSLHFGTDSAFVLGDLANVAASAIPDIELITASFPCTDLSLAGARKGLDGERSSAFWLLIQLIREMGSRRPKLILIENVPGFVSSNGGRDLVAALEALNQLGYAVDLLTIDASHFVPQSRNRLFIVGALNSPLKEARKDFGSLAVEEFRDSHREIQWLNWKLPSLPVRATSLVDILDTLDDADPSWWSDERVRKLYGQLHLRHLQPIEQAEKMGEVTYATAFRRIRNGECRAELRTDGMAGCLRTPKGGSAKQILLKFGKGHRCARLVSPRECARLMGADDFILDCSVQRALYGFGDAVCVPVVAWLAENYLNPLLESLRICTVSTDVREAV